MAPPLLLQALVASAVFFCSDRVTAQQTTTVVCDSEDELLVNLRFVRSVCEQLGEPFAEQDALVPTAVTTEGCARTLRHVAHDCNGLLSRSPNWFASRKAALDAAVATAAAVPDAAVGTRHISPIHT